MEARRDRIANLNAGGIEDREAGNEDTGKTIDNSGDWFRELLGENAHFEQDAQILEKLRRVEARLQADRPEENRKVAEVPWLDEFTAFAVTGRYIYISRRLYQLCDTDEKVAFVIAHELAHHDLGHLDIFDGWGGLRSMPGAWALAAIFQALESRVYGVEKECEADKHGLRLCVNAGYDAEACLCLFDVLEEHLLNHGGFDAVYGLDEESDRELCEDADWITKLKIWTWHRWMGYLPIRDRRQVLLEHSREILECSRVEQES